MNREILFKAKRNNWNELPKEQWWVEGYYCKKKTGHYTDIGFVEEYKDCIITEFSDGGISWCYVDPSTICQYTGLTDKNGKKIWENDIIRTSKYGRDDGKGRNYTGFDVFSVKWDNGSFALFNRWRRFNLREDKKEYEVIGNIFDNPELLKG